MGITRRQALQATAGFGLALAGCQGNSSSHPPKLVIATATNLQFAMTALVGAFKAHTAIACNVIHGSSGKLTAQIKSGAPFDLFVSADLKYPTTLFKDGFATAAPITYAYGKLALWTVNPKLEPSFQDLTQPNIRHIAIANPKIAPYGAAAIASLKHQGLYPAIQDKLVFGESIAHVNYFITSQAADIGITAESIVRSTTFHNKGRWQTVPPTSYPALAQGVIPLKNREGLPQESSTQLRSQAQQFQAFLLSPTGQRILKDFGYGLPS